MDDLNFEGDGMINADEFKKQMRDPSVMNYDCPTGGCGYGNCPMYLTVSIGITNIYGSINNTTCLTMMARFLDREWKKEEARYKVAQA